ncbi:MAG: cation transporter [Egibacteraceae bacterium]
MSATAREQITLAISGMHCVSCGLLIDDVLEDLPGVIESRTDVKRGRTQLRIDPGVARITQLLDAVRSAGYQAEADGNGSA